jgi:hypothetical protein
MRSLSRFQTLKPHARQERESLRPSRISTLQWNKQTTGMVLDDRSPLEEGAHNPLRRHFHPRLGDSRRASTGA